MRGANRSISSLLFLGSGMALRLTHMVVVTVAGPGSAPRRQRSRTRMPHAGGQEITSAGLAEAQYEESHESREQYEDKVLFRPGAFPSLSQPLRTAFSRFRGPAARRRELYEGVLQGSSAAAPASVPPLSFEEGMTSRSLPAAGLPLTNVSLAFQGAMSALSARAADFFTEAVEPSAPIPASGTRFSQPEARPPPGPGHRPRLPPAIDAGLSGKEFGKTGEAATAASGQASVQGFLPSTGRLFSSIMIPVGTPSSAAVAAAGNPGPGSVAPARGQEALEPRESNLTSLSAEGYAAPFRPSPGREGPPESPSPESFASPLVSSAERKPSGLEAASPESLQARLRGGETIFSSLRAVVMLSAGAAALGLRPNLSSAGYLGHARLLGGEGTAAPSGLNAEAAGERLQFDSGYAAAEMYAASGVLPLEREAAASTLDQSRGQIFGQRWTAALGRILSVGRTLPSVLGTAAAARGPLPPTSTGSREGTAPYQARFEPRAREGAALEARGAEGGWTPIVTEMRGDEGISPSPSPLMVAGLAAAILAGAQFEAVLPASRAIADLAANYQEPVGRGMGGGTAVSTSVVPGPLTRSALGSAAAKADALGRVLSTLGTAGAARSPLLASTGTREGPAMHAPERQSTEERDARQPVPDGQRAGSENAIVEEVETQSPESPAPRLSDLTLPSTAGRAGGVQGMAVPATSVVQGKPAPRSRPWNEPGRFLRGLLLSPATIMASELSSMGATLSLVPPVSVGTMAARARHAEAPAQAERAPSPTAPVSTERPEVELRDAIRDPSPGAQTGDDMRGEDLSDLRSRIAKLLDEELRRYGIE